MARASHARALSVMTAEALAMPRRNGQQGTLEDPSLDNLPRELVIAGRRLRNRLDHSITWSAREQRGLTIITSAITSARAFMIVSLRWRQPYQRPVVAPLERILSVVRIVAYRF